MDTASFNFHLSVPLQHSLEKMSEEIESSWKRRVAFGLGVVKEVEESAKKGREKKREFNQESGAQGQEEKTKQKQKKTKKLLKRTGNTDKPELWKKCSIGLWGASADFAQETTDMRNKLEDKELFFKNPFYFYPVWHRQFELNSVFILIRSDFYINKIIFLRKIFCWFLASLGIKPL